MEKPKLMDVVTTVVTALSPFESAERKRIIKAAMTILEEDLVDEKIEAPKKPEETITEATQNIHANAQRWMKTNKLSREELEQVFQIENGTTEVLGVTLPANNKKENAHGVYLLVGIASLIATGEANVDDKIARQKCADLGCYDASNHSVYMKDFGNVMNGSKNTGYKVTAPGLTAAAGLVKTLVKKPE